MSEFAITNILQNARDGYSKAITMVGEWEHNNHEGKAYYVEDNIELTDTEQLTVKFSVPHGPEECHFSWDIKATGVCQITFHEDALGGMTGGTSVAVLNANRNSAYGSSMVVFSGVTTSTAVGILIHDWRSGTISNKSDISGGGAERNSEVILKKGTTMLGRIVSGTTGNVVSFRSAWTEHAPATGLKVAD